MAAALFWTRAELRGRWRAWVGVVLLIGLSGGAALAATSGARRTASAFDRFQVAAAAPHAVVLNPVGGDPALLDAVERLAGVVVSGRTAILFSVPAGTDLRPDVDTVVMAALDDRSQRVIDRLRVLRGRLPAVDRDDEVSVSEALARRLELEPGDRFTLQGPSPEEQAGCAETFACHRFRGGPAVPVVVVGVTRSLSDLVNRTFDTLEISASVAFSQRYADRMASPGTALTVRLAGGEANLPAFQAAVAGISEDLYVESGPSGEVDDALRVQAQGLLVFAAAAALAGLLAVGQAFARLAAAAADGLAVLGALGAGRLQRSLAAVGPLAVVAPAGVVLAASLAWLASPLLPIGLGRRAEPDPGLAFDASVLVLGALALVAAVLARAWVSAARSAGAATGAVDQGRSQGAQPGAVPSFPGVFPPAALSVGARMAVGRGTGVNAIPVRSTLVGAVVGVAGLVGALTFGQSAARLQSDSALYGAPWTAQVGFVADDPDVIGAARAAVDRVGRVDAVGLVGSGRLSAEGRPDVLAVAVQPQRGAIGATVLEGRAPVAPDEVLAGGNLLGALGRDVGGTISLAGDAGAGAYRIVGRGSVPIVATDRRTEGMVLTTEGLERLVSSLAGEDGRALLVRWMPGTDLALARTMIEEAGFVYDPPLLPTEVANLGELGAIPEVLAGFLALLGLTATAHALAVTVRRRRRHLAVLRALGFTRGETRWTVACQAMTTAAVGLAIGIPLGLVIGRGAWSSVADGLDVVDRPSISIGALLLAVPACLALVSLVAMVLSPGVTRPRPAAMLRDE